MHILTKCKKATQELKDKVQGSLAKNAIKLDEPKAERKAAKRAAAQSRLSDNFDSRRTTAEQHRQLDTQLLRALVSSGSSFSLAENPWFLQYNNNLRPTYEPASEDEPCACIDAQADSETASRHKSGCELLLPLQAQIHCGERCLFRSWQGASSS